jgi:hypothetical protein
VRGRRLPQDHLLPRPPGRDEHVHHHGDRRAAQLPGAAVQRQPDRQRPGRRRPPLGDLGRPVQETGVPVRAGGR